MNYRQNADSQRRYAIRKMRVCVGSVLVGFFLLAGNMATVQAAETSVADSTMLAVEGNNSTADATFSRSDERPATENTSTESGGKEDFLKEALPTSTENSYISTEESKSDSDVPKEKTLPTSVEESTKVSDNKVSNDYETIKKTILNPIAHNYYEDEQYELSQREATVERNKSIRLTLKSSDGKDVTDQVTWYVRTRYPSDEVYEHSKEVKNSTGKTFLRLDKDGTLTSLNQDDEQFVDLWGYYNQHLYRAKLILPGKVGMEDITQEEAAHREAEKIVKAFEGMSDVEKVKAAHDWLVDNVDYVARSGQDQSAYSALVEKKTVCAGYGHGLKLLLDKMNIPSQTLVGPVGSERHLWNVVELDGKWYHVDATWDDAGFKDAKYTRKSEHLLIHDEDFELTRKTKRDFIKSNDMGEHYRYYGFEKHGVLARNLEDVQTVLERQYHKAVLRNDSSTIIDIMAPNKITSDEIQSKLRRLDDVVKYGIYQEYYGGYTLHRFGVTLLPQKVETTVKVEQLQTEISTKNPRISNILVKLDQGVELNKANITVTGAKLTGIEKVNGTNKEYRLLLDEPERMVATTVQVAIHKRKHQFVLTNPEISINVKRAAQPEAFFVATGQTEGYLSNVKPGMEYRILRGPWQTINDSQVKLTNIGPGEIYVRVKETPDAFASQIQYVKVTKAGDPREVKALPDRIVGVTKDMEYRLKDKGDRTWIQVTSKILTNLVNGEYEVRRRVNGNQLASNTNTEKLVITAGIEATPRNIAEQERKAKTAAKEGKVLVSNSMVTSRWYKDTTTNVWYYFNEAGAKVKNTWVGDYYLLSDGKMAVNKWIQDTAKSTWYYVNGTGAKVKNTWVGEYYLLSDGKMAANKWIQDTAKGTWYYVNGTGAKVKNTWVGEYYLLSDGKMAANKWIQDTAKGTWYYVNGTGAKVKNTWVGDYYLLSDGKMAANKWIQDTAKGTWYYVNGTGAKAKNTWVGDYYLLSDGKMAANKWIQDTAKGTWYYVNGTGAKVKNTWVGEYHLLSDGKMAANKWIQDTAKGTWYYVNGTGAKAKNTWVGDYYLLSDGKMAANKWIQDTAKGTWYYVNGTGAKAKNTWVGDYYLLSDGKMAVNKWIQDTATGTWYYVNGTGAKAKNTWVGDYYLLSDGKMATNQWIQDTATGTRYYVNGSGAKVKNT
ncbi:YSIRK-type signal peptide-containing protein [Streptococcus ruminantium]|uniref:YSIRK-type signal peptide-containing protein n=1 Tax=Streptococcus ruminantium TaxID=1917441 RepID=UPI0012DF5A6B|nr:transglutaminase domain-containing protein [Streptococcus ruminantium]